MPVFRFTLEYDGTDFEGWQRQREPKRTVQGTFEAALSRLTRREVRVTGAGRTDAGAHALAQVATAEAETPLDPQTLQRALNAGLPDDLRIVACSEAPPGFHPRRDAQGKHYRYRVWNRREAAPLLRRVTHHVPYPLALPPMREAASHWLGTHDFKSFETAGSAPESTVRTLQSLEITGENGGELRFDVRGNGFLRHMVRNLVGTLIEIGAGRRKAAEAKPILAARDRSAAGAAAPAKGLVLVSVDYGNL